MTVFIRTRRPTTQVFSGPVAATEDEVVAAAARVRAFAVAGATEDEVGVVVASSGSGPAYGEDPSDVLAWDDDLDGYASMAAATTPTGPYGITEGSGGSVIFLDPSAGYGGSQCLRWDWPISTSPSGQNHTIERLFSSGVSGSQSGGIAYVRGRCRFDPDFIFATTGNRVGKKFMLINVGETCRLTVGIGNVHTPGVESFTFDMTQTGGQPKLESAQNLEPYGTLGSGASVDRIRDGSWHEWVVGRKSESVDGALDGWVRMWLDGELITDFDGLGTDDRVMVNFQIASTFNGGSPQEQSEWHDDLQVWSRQP